MVIKKVASTDTKLFGTHEILDTKNRVYQGLILKNCLNWLNLKERMHWLGRRKEGLL
jgi:hypothetical protein